jgi:hypothetical protein
MKISLSTRSSNRDGSPVEGVSVSEVAIRDRFNVVPLDAKLSPVVLGSSRTGRDGSAVVRAADVSVGELRVFVLEKKLFIFVPALSPANPRDHPPPPPTSIACLPFPRRESFPMRAAR